MHFIEDIETYHLDIHAEHPEVLSTILDVIWYVPVQHVEDDLQQFIKTLVRLKQ